MSQHFFDVLTLDTPNGKVYNVVKAELSAPNKYTVIQPYYGVENRTKAYTFCKRLIDMDKARTSLESELKRVTDRATDDGTVEVFADAYIKAINDKLINICAQISEMLGDKNDKL